MKNTTEIMKQELVAQPYPIHEAVYLFPEMPAGDFEELKEDIAEHGLRVPILLCNGKVIDGRHRLRACTELGVVPRFEEMEAANDEAINQVVVSINLHRRHLNESQRALIAARLTNSSIGANQHTSGVISQQQAANELGISVDSVTRGKKVLQHGSPELVTAVAAGKLNISNASRLASLSRQDQAQLNFDDIKAIQDASKAINKAKFEARRQERIQQIEAKRANNKPLEASLGSFSVVYADPPWNYMGELSVGYPCMSTQEICDMPIHDVTTEDAVLFLWCSSSLLAEGLQVMSAWGFTFKTSAVWDKNVMGQGAYFRQAHEVLMIGIKGQVPEVPYSSRPSSVLKFPRAEHSRKPVDLYQIIDDMYPELAKVELFCRGEPPEGWIGWGNECTQQPVNQGIQGINGSSDSNTDTTQP